MPALEIGYCDRSEYDSGANDRIQPAELVLDELYVFMAAIQVTSRKRIKRNPQALRELCQIYNTTVQPSGLYHVQFEILDEDNQGEWATGGMFEDGYWTEMDKGEDLGITGIKVITGYFSNYVDPVDNEIKSFFDTQQMPALVSV